ncbi:MAG TPA: TrkA C-terminal domain-containing protein [Victivallales bacterium]|nr:TrkA C-terminal domain-containing protein [Victivallales bacterium]
MIGVISLLLIISLTLFVTRIATLVLMMTGVSRPIAEFQSRSAYSGAGFTTQEAEAIVNHPVRRKIIYSLMFIGNIGIATVVATIILSVLNSYNSQQWWVHVLILTGGVIFLSILTYSKRFDNWINEIIYKSLKRYSKLDIKDYLSILHLHSGYSISELSIVSKDWLAGKTLKESEISKEGVLVLGIKRKNGDYVGTPQSDTKIIDGDTLIVYAHTDKLEELSGRHFGKKGEKAHTEAINKQAGYLKKQAENDEVSSSEEKE